jgi:hypothetical protein
MHCCKECFWDLDLRNEIQLNSENEGNCEFCGSYAPLLMPKLLRNKFEFLKEEMFANCDDSEFTLAECFQKEFSVFNEEKVRNINRLLDEIFLDDKEYVSGKFRLIVENNRFSYDWELLRKELISKNRFFPQTKSLADMLRGNQSSELKVFEMLISQLTSTLPIDYPLYRARIIDPIVNFKKELDKPPAKLAGDGRANPVGISYLYCADDKETAVTEIRPSTGSIVHIASLITNRSVNILDLTNPRKSYSAFQFADSDSVLALELIVLLERLSYELSIPIAESRHLYYLPTQFFCEFIKSQRTVDGIVFSSSFTNKKNYVFFNEKSEEIVEFTSFEKVCVTKTVHEYE